MRNHIRSARKSQLTREALLLAALLLIAVAAGLALVPRGGPALADRLFQSPPTNTPDPNTPVQTPTATGTPDFTETPTLTATPSETASHTPSATPTSLVLPTDTPTALPTDTPFLPPTEPPVLPSTDTPAPPLLDPLLGSPLDTPTPTPVLALPGPTLGLSQPITLPLAVDAAAETGAAEPRAAVQEEAAARRLDPALFIDNMVIAFGYVWMCFGLLTLAGAGLGGLLLWQRRRRQPAQPAPTPGPTSVPRPATPATAPPPAAPPPPPPTRVTARRGSPPPKDLD